ncbi:hypothetical protein [Legionella worsleiensis]|uniref:Uncharacterized protein n=1 Tax=Legionella worsleiensis TaxID=45076 RepID=A0A0W1A6N1_9GAMM|nr:hypothetical protein [Legionella worsleiensis]KTD76980.1 hypothetical protein Lwor_2205 [Legionella worsleiensis]STY33348.1 Uncharacterised protein [Legionella worsleiensis]
MFEWLTEWLAGMGLNPYTSTTGHRNAERVNAGTQLLSYSFQQQPYVMIATKLSQCIASFYSLFRSDTKIPEKIIHLLQMTISGAELGIQTTLLFKSLTCELASENQLCTAALLLEVLYDGTLGVGWVPSEFSKQPYEPVNAGQPINAALGA